MSDRPDIDELLAQQLGALGRRGVEDVPFDIGDSAAAGASWAARRLSSEEHEAVRELPVDAATLLTRVAAAIERQAPADVEPAPDGVGMRTVVGSGFLSMNPAVLTVTVEAIDDAHARVRIHAAAKEGLIKQRTAEKAVAKVIEALEQVH